MNSSNNLWELISLKLSGEAGEQQLRMLESLTATDPVLLTQLQILEAWWKCQAPANEKTFSVFFEKLHKRITQ